MNTEHTVILHPHFQATRIVTDVDCSLAVLQGDGKARGGVGWGRRGGAELFGLCCPFSTKSVPAPLPGQYLI